MSKLAVVTILLVATLASSACERPVEVTSGREPHRTARYLTAVTLSPIWATVLPATSLSVSAYGRYNTGDAAPLTTGVRYSASAGTITPSGVFTPGPRAGGYIVFAEADGLSDMAFVTVKPPPASLADVPSGSPTPVSPPWWVSLIALVVVGPLLSKLCWWWVEGQLKEREARKVEEEWRNRRRIGFLVSLPLAVLILVTVTVGLHSTTYVTVGACLALLWMVLTRFRQLPPAQLD
jgi:hypothetical protein